MNYVTTHTVQERSNWFCFITSQTFAWIFIGAVLITLCKHATNRAENTLQQQHKKAVRETIPFIIFIIAHQIPIIVAMVVLACQFYIHKEREEVLFILWVCFGLYPLALVFIPVLLLSQSHIQRILIILCKKLQNLTNVKNTTGYGTTVLTPPPASPHTLQHPS